MHADEYDVFPIVVPVVRSLRTVNFYLVKDAQSLVLIDAGLNNDDCWRELNKTLAEHDFSLGDLTHILLTHHHIDHVGLVNRIVSIRPVPVYCHPLSVPRLKREKDFLDMRIAFFAKLYEEMGCGEMGRKRVKELKKAKTANASQKIDCDLIPFSDQRFMHFDVVEFPGHAPDQVGFYDQHRALLFAGDLLIEHISSNALVEPDEFGRKMDTLVKHVDSLKKCKALDLSLVYPGHGNPIKKPEALIEKRLAGIERKSVAFLSLIQSGKTTASEIAKAYYRETYTKQFSLVMSEVIGHLDYLEAQGKINKEFVKGIWHYSLVDQASLCFKNV